MRPCAYSYVHARITKTQYHRTGRSPGWRRPPISGTAQPRAQEHRCRAGAVCSAVVTARFLKGILLSHASHACDHTHTPIHTHTLQTIETTGQLPTPPACSTPLGTMVPRFFAGAAEQHGKTAASREQKLLGNERFTPVLPVVAELFVSQKFLFPEPQSCPQSRLDTQRCRRPTRSLCDHTHSSRVIECSTHLPWIKRLGEHVSQ